MNNPFQNPKGAVSLQKAMISKRITDSISKGKRSCVANLIFNSKGELLLLQRAEDDSFHPNTWCLAGGGIDGIETFKTACVRETKEETGLYISTVNLVKTVKLKDIDIYYFQSMVDEDSEPFIILDEAEHQKYKFCTEEDWLEMDLILDLKAHLCDILDVEVTVFDEDIQKAVAAEEGDGKVVKDKDIDESGDGENDDEQEVDDEGEANENGKKKGDIKKALEDLLEKGEFSGKERKKLAKEGEAEKNGSYPIESEKDLKDAIEALGRSKDKAATKAWIKKRAKEMDLEDKLPESWSKKKDKIEKSLEDLLGEDYLEKAEGSRGGKVIGHTKSGKAIYDKANHKSHKDFTSKDHKEAASYHAGLQQKYSDKDNKDKSEYHSDEADKHYDMSEKVDKNKEAKDSADLEQIERARNVATSKDSSEEDKKKAKKFLDDKKDDKIEYIKKAKEFVKEFNLKVGSKVTLPEIKADEIPEETGKILSIDTKSGTFIIQVDNPPKGDDGLREVPLEKESIKNVYEDKKKKKGLDDSKDDDDYSNKNRIIGNGSKTIKKSEDDKIEKGGPGSGKKKGDNSPDKGKTSTGKHISHLEGAGHPMYENFNSSEHKEAADHLKKRGHEHFSESLNHKEKSAEHDSHSSEGERLQKLGLTHITMSNSKKKNEEDKKRLEKSLENEFNNLIGDIEKGGIGSGRHKEYKAGAKAFEEGMHKKDHKKNPHKEDTDNHKEWKQGWSDAQDEASEEWANEQVRKNK